MVADTIECHSGFYEDAANPGDPWLLGPALFQACMPRPHTPNLDIVPVVGIGSDRANARKNLGNDRGMPAGPVR